MKKQEGKEQILQALKRLMRMAQELEEQLLNIQRQKYRGIRLQQKQLSAILYTPCIGSLSVVWWLVCASRLSVHVRAESRYLNVSVRLY